MKYKPEVCCRACAGYGEVVCTCCNNDDECEQCGGDGLNPHAVDLIGYHAACEKLGYPSWSVMERLHVIGRTNGKQQVLIADHLIKREANA